MPSSHGNAHATTKHACDWRGQVCIYAHVQERTVPPGVLLCLCGFAIATLHLCVHVLAFVCTLVQEHVCLCLCGCARVCTCVHVCMRAFVRVFAIRAHVRVCGCMHATYLHVYANRLHVFAVHAHVCACVCPLKCVHPCTLTTAQRIPADEVNSIVRSKHMAQAVPGSRSQQQCCGTPHSKCRRCLQWNINCQRIKEQGMSGSRRAHEQDSQTSTESFTQDRIIGANLKTKHSRCVQEIWPAMEWWLRLFF